MGQRPASEIAIRDQHRTQFAAGSGIHLQQRCSHAAGWSETDDLGRHQVEVSTPVVAPWIEQRGKIACKWVDRSQIRPLLPIAAIACKSEVVELV